MSNNEEKAFPDYQAGEPKKTFKQRQREVMALVLELVIRGAKEDQTLDDVFRQKDKRIFFGNAQEHKEQGAPEVDLVVELDGYDQARTCELLKTYLEVRLQLNREAGSRVNRLLDAYASMLQCGQATLDAITRLPKTDDQFLLALREPGGIYAQALKEAGLDNKGKLLFMLAKIQDWYWVAQNISLFSKIDRCNTLNYIKESKSLSLPTMETWFDVKSFVDVFFPEARHNALPYIEKSKSLSLPTMEYWSGVKRFVDVFFPEARHNALPYIEKSKSLSLPTMEAWYNVEFFVNSFFPKARRNALQYIEKSKSLSLPTMETWYNVKTFVNTFFPEARHNALPYIEKSKSLSLPTMKTWNNVGTFVYVFFSEAGFNALQYIEKSESLSLPTIKAWHNVRTFVDEFFPEATCNALPYIEKSKSLSLPEIISGISVMYFIDVFFRDEPERGRAYLEEKGMLAGNLKAKTALKRPLKKSGKEEKTSGVGIFFGRNNDETRRNSSLQKERAFDSNN